MIKFLKQFIIGRAKNPLDPRIFRNLSLIAFFAWVGLGSDGLSSSCYGPEEAFLALGSHQYLALYLALATTITVLIISASYSQIIELFPSGGGGYLVATRLLSPTAGVVSGCALLVDYNLTIAVSVASGADAIFSFLPLVYQKYKLVSEVVMIGVLTLLNLKGVKESVKVLLPIFLLFVITHIIVISQGIFLHLERVPDLLSHTGEQTIAGVRELGPLMMLFIFLRAFSMGAGTYTGIEAVSNGLPVLREPQVQTGKKTLLYLAISLSITASGIIICYLLNDVSFQAGKTLNASLIEKIASGWKMGEFSIGIWFILLTLISEGAILFVAAQTGFVDGPRVLSNMALDGWIPRRFAYLSDRLVTQNGILLMCFASLSILLYTGGSVKFLVIIYSINVFLTFTLSQLGMCVHWLKSKHEAQWVRKLIINGIGLILTLSILSTTIAIKFREGGWLTLAITTGLIIICFIVKGHYKGVKGALARLDQLAVAIESSSQTPPQGIPSKDANTAVVLVSGYNGLGLHTLLSIQKLLPYHFERHIFLSIGEIDSSKFKGRDEVEHLRTTTENDLKKYVTAANRLGLYAEYRFSLGTDPIDELEKVCLEIAKQYPNTIFFAGKLVFKEETFLNRFLHNQAAYVLQQRLIFHGLQTMILPIRVM
jgi:amino acid transporter